MSFDTTQTDEFRERQGVDGQKLVWIEARNRQTGAIEGMGLWSGDDDQSFVVDGVLRSFHGAGAVIGIPPVRAGIGLQVRRHRIILPPMRDEVRLVLQVYQAAQAKVRVWSQPMSVHTGAPLSAPIRVIKGRLEKAPETMAARGGRSRTELIVATGARALTFTVPWFKSDAAMRLRNPADRAREYIDTIADRAVPWGQSSVRAAPPAPFDPEERDESDRR